MESKKNNFYSVPEGYFDNLQARLQAIPAEHPLPMTVKFTETVPKARPARWYRPLAIAAGLAVAFIIGSTALKTSGDKAYDQTFYEELLYSDLVPRTDPYLIYGEPSSDRDDYNLSSSDIENYLINTGASLEQIVFTY